MKNEIRPEIETVFPDNLHYIKNRISEFFDKGKIVNYSLLNITLEEVVESEQEDIVVSLVKTEEMPILDYDTEIAHVNNRDKLLLPPDKQISLEDGDLFYMSNVQLMIEKNNKILCSPKVIYVYEHILTESELLSSSYIQNSA